MSKNWHIWSTREGKRGIRAFATLHPSDRSKADRIEARFEGYVFSGAQHTGLGLRTDDDTAGVQLFAGLSKVACAWLSLGSPALSSARYKRTKKLRPDLDLFELWFHDHAVWWSVWHPQHEWKKGTPKWRNGSFHWWDWLTGKPVHSSEVTEGPVDVVIPMPEGGYRATVTIKRSTWNRPRWPWPQEHYGYEVDVLSRPGPDGPYLPEGTGPRTNGYIPVPGKGENSWDCGGDGIFAMSGPGKTVEKAIGDVVASALRDRKRHAGRHDYAEAIS